MEIFIPGLNIYTPVEIYIPWWKYLYPGGNILTGWELKKIIMSYVGHRICICFCTLIKTEAINTEAIKTDNVDIHIIYIFTLKLGWYLKKKIYIYITVYSFKYT